MRTICGTIVAAALVASCADAREGAGRIVLAGRCGNMESSVALVQINRNTKER